MIEADDRNALAPELLAAAYATLGQRRTNYETLMWQVPALSIAAQAFLLTIVLAPDSTRLARLLAASLAFITASISIHLMAKHRYMERIDTILLETLEKTNHFPLPLHSQLDERREAAGISFRPITMLLVRRSLFRLWMVVLSVFALVSISLFVLALIDVTALTVLK